MKMSDNPNPSILFTEHVDPDPPAAGHQRMWVDTDHHLKSIDSSSTVVDWSAGAVGDVSADGIWDAKGDLAVGTGANAASRLAVGANGTVVTATSGATTGLAYALPPGYEIDYVQVTTADITVSGTNEAGATTLVTGNAIAYDGSTAVIIEFFTPGVVPGGTDSILFWLYDGSSSVGTFGAVVDPAAGAMQVPFLARIRITPSNATHTYGVRASRGSNNGHVYGGAGGTGVYWPLYIRITRA